MNTSEGRPATILVVEDVDWIRAGMKRVLRRYGYRILEAPDEATAIEIAERERPELILTEEQFPSFDTLTTRLRQLPALQDLPLVIVNPDAAEHTRYGDAHVLNDFAQIETLLQRLGKLIEKRT